MDTEILPFGLAFENQHESGPVALLSFYEQQNFVDDLGRPAYIKALTETSLQAVKDVGGLRYYGGSFDTNAVVGEDLVLDEVPNKHAAFLVLKQLETLAFSGVVGKLTVLAFKPARLPFGITLSSGLSVLSRILNTIAPITDKKWNKRREEEFLASTNVDGIQTEITNMYNEDLAEKKMFMLNLNKYKKVATYEPGTKEAEDEPISGREAYGRYGKGGGFNIFRRGGYPYYMGFNCQTVLITEQDTLEGQEWDQIILVHYPYRNKVIEMVTSDSYAARFYHRTAGMERAVVKPTLPWWDTPSDDYEIMSRM